MPELTLYYYIVLSISVLTHLLKLGFEKYNIKHSDFLFDVIYSLPLTVLTAYFLIDLKSLIITTFVALSLKA